MRLVIDANIVVGFYQDTVLSQEHELTRSPSFIFENLGRRHVIYVDDKNNVMSEWRAGVSPEWFDAWYANLLRDDFVREISAPPDKILRKELLEFGFPATSRDLWYAKLSNAVSKKYGSSVLISEDLDFYEPKEKGCDASRRLDILLKELGTVRKYLKKNRQIHVKAVACFLSYQTEAAAEQLTTK